jgi:iron complex outermembrane receptor protein
MITLSAFRAAPGGKRAVAIALLASSCAVCATSAAEGPRDLTALPFEQLLTIEVFSASKFVQPSSQAPALVTVITGADIRSFGWRSLGDVARSVRGLYVSYDRNYSYLGARGFLRPGDYNTRFLLLVDGNRINDAVYDQAPVGGRIPGRTGPDRAHRICARPRLFDLRLQCILRGDQCDHEKECRAARRADRR